jgi:hypothetical protein
MPSRPRVADTYAPSTETAPATNTLSTVSPWAAWDVTA